MGTLPGTRTQYLRLPIYIGIRDGCACTPAQASGMVHNAPARRSPSAELALSAGSCADPVCPTADRGQLARHVLVAWRYKSWFFGVWAKEASVTTAREHAAPQEEQVDGVKG